MTGGPGLSRRAWLGTAVAGLAATRLPAAATATATGEPLPSAIAIRSSGAHDYRPALAAIRACGLAELEAVGLPGMTISVAATDGFSATLSLGWADRADRTAVSPDQLFEIGSISKSLCAFWLHAQAARGEIDLAAPVSRYLPDLPLPPEPITLRQLLNHTGGLPDDAPPFPHVPGGRWWTGFAPGTRFSYSNVGYDWLGLVVDRVAGRPHAQVLAQEVLAPLGMAGAVAQIRSTDRPRFATGHAPLFDDRPALARAPLTQGPWTQEDGASGSVAASAAGMIGYLRYLMQLGTGKGAPLMPDRAAAALLAADVAAPPFGARARYASGIATQTIDGRRLLHHTGGMLAYSSSFHVDAAAGTACFASVNARLGDYRPQRLTSHAVAVLRAARAARAPPPPPDPLAFGRIREPRRFAGRWVAAAGDTLELLPAPGGLALAADGARGRLEAINDRTLATDHPVRAIHQLELDRGGTRLWWGGIAFARGRAPAAPAVPAALRRLEGSYAAHDPWGPTLAVFARGDRLWAEPLGEIVERPGGFWSTVDDKGGIDRLWFDAPVAGRPTRLSLNGYEAQRLD